MRKLTYQDLELGTRTLRAFEHAQKKDFKWLRANVGEEAEARAREGKVAFVDYLSRTHPCYLNTKQVYTTSDGTELNTTDLINAAVLAGVNGFLMGKQGSGKSRVMQDIATHLFGGKVENGGYSLITEAHNDFDLESLFLQFNTKTGKVELLDTVKACFYDIEEFNRAHPAVQNQFYSFGNGRLLLRGFDTPLGREGYAVAFATGNDPRNPEHSGTFESDPAMLNRFCFALDLNNAIFSTTENDQRVISNGVLRSASAKLETGIGENKTDMLVKAYHEISKRTIDMPLETRAVISYLNECVTKCPGRNGNKKDIRPKANLDGKFPGGCQECTTKERITANGKDTLTAPICKMVNLDNPRIIQNTIRYVAALEYLLRLKNPNADINYSDLTFLAFEVCSAYQDGILNKEILQTDYSNNNHKMMQEVGQRLRAEFEKISPYMLAQLESDEPMAFLKSSSGEISGVKLQDLDDPTALTKKGSKSYNPYSEPSLTPFESLETLIKFQRQYGMNW